MAIEKNSQVFDVVIVGAGAAGVGVAISLLHAGIDNFQIVDRNGVGSSFESWPAETRFITPSFPSNSIGMLDLNSIAIGVSPAFVMKVEHPTGSEYAQHLKDLSKFFELPVIGNTDITKIEKINAIFHLTSEKTVLKSKNVIWAAGEYQYPSVNIFEGSELCHHTATIEKYNGMEGDEIIIIGGYESGIDAAYHLAKQSKKVSVFDINSPWEESSSDPSVALSTFSYERMQDSSFKKNVDLYPKTKIKSVNFNGELYEVTTDQGKIFKSKVKPLLASGFEGSHKFLSNLFDFRDDGFPLLNEKDESTILPGMFLCGPLVRHDNHIFCFIYKYRQRFGIVAQAIASSMGLETDEFIAGYRLWGMYLDDLSCCGQECLTC